MFLVYLNILTQSITITDSMFNVGNYFTKFAISFDLTETEKNIYFIGMDFIACKVPNTAKLI